MKEVDHVPFIRHCLSHRHVRVADRVAHGRQGANQEYYGLCRPGLPPVEGVFELAAIRAQCHRRDLKLKHGSYKDVSISLADDDKPAQKLSISNDGHITPLPNLAQLKSGAQVTVSGPDGMGPALRLRVVSAQGNTSEFDATSLATAQIQTMKAEKKLAGAMGMFVKIPVLDRAYFSGATSGVIVMKDGSQKPLPTIHDKYAFIPSGTPYFVPSDYPQAVKIKLNTIITHAFIDEKAH